MRVVMALDWAEHAFSAVRQALELYAVKDAVLVHGVDLGLFQYPLIAEMSNLQGYDDFRKAMRQAGEQLLDHAATLLPRQGVTVRRVCEFAKPAALIIDTAKKEQADLIAIGARGRGRVGEVLLGSVSHRVAQHAHCSTLVVKDRMGPVKRVVVAVESHEDGTRIKDWLIRHPFKEPAGLTLVSVVRPIPATDPFSLFPVQDWTDTAVRHAEDVVKQLGTAVMDHRYSVGTHVAVGDPVEVVIQQADSADLLIIGSHGRKAVERFLLGSISHALVHRSACPVLIVR
ncbi:MAG: universal stress protein [Nitrospiraceae bacterium]|nr:universal stress protein [Nitrospiraceae bacterium]